jgi:hypothetical protein
MAPTPSRRRTRVVYIIFILAIAILFLSFTREATTRVALASVVAPGGKDLSRLVRQAKHSFARAASAEEDEDGDGDGDGDMEMDRDMDGDEDGDGDGDGDGDASTTAVPILAFAEQHVNAHAAAGPGEVHGATVETPPPSPISEPESAAETALKLEPAQV